MAGRNEKPVSANKRIRRLENEKKRDFSVDDSGDGGR